MTDDVTRNCDHRVVEPMHDDEHTILVGAQCIICGVVGWVDRFNMTFEPVSYKC